MSGPTYIIANIHHWMREENEEFHSYLQEIRDAGYQVVELSPDLNGYVDYCITFESDADAVLFKLKYK